MGYLKTDPFHRSAIHEKITSRMGYAYNEKFMMAFPAKAVHDLWDEIPGDENDKFNLIYNVGKKDNEYTSSFSDSKFSFNQNIPLENIGLGDFKYGDELSYAVTIDPTTYTQTIYVNGLPVASGDYSKEQWDEFASELASRIEYYYIGRSSYDNRWHYSNTEIYGLSLYNRALNAEEILANYNAMVSYHDILENGSEVKTTE